MAITRRQFVTRMGALAAAVGFSQADVSQIAEAFASNSNSGVYGPGTAKPRVIWIHGAECTGCSTSLLGILESAGGKPIYGDKTTTLLDVAVGAGVTATGNIAGASANKFTLWDNTKNLIEDASLVNIADVVIDVIDLQYHETVMGMGGDLAAQWLNDFKTFPENPNRATKQPGDYPFVLVVEGALQDRTQGGAWNDTSASTPWCSIGMSDDSTIEHDMAETVVALASKSTCAAVIPIGQCASFGGYPGCKPQISSDASGMTLGQSQTGAQGVSDYFASHGKSALLSKVINVPGCPTNPWWFVLTVMMFMYNLAKPGYLDMSTDTQGRLKAVYPIPVHSSYCPRYPKFVAGLFATKPGDAGCLQKLGCKGIAANSLCGAHGWNNHQPQNGSLSVTDSLGETTRGGHCTRAGHPCMACTEKGYPDSFVPFIKRS